MADILHYFGLEKGYELKWAHAVNSKYLLKRAIEDPSIHMLEVDVSLLSSDGVTPICAHPPETASDLTLMECLDTLWGVCQTPDSHSVNRKGLKLDFKSTNAVIIVSQLLEYYLIGSTKDSKKPFSWPPLILNADVCQGPGFEGTKESSKPLVDAHEMLEAGKRLPFSHISLGWTSHVEAPKLSAGAVNKKHNLEPTSKTFYTTEMIEEMLEITLKISNPLMLVFRACYIVNRDDDDKWWNDAVLGKFLKKRETALFDADGDVVRKTGASDKPDDNGGVSDSSFLLWSHGRDDINGDSLQQFVLRQSVGEKPAVDSNASEPPPTPIPKCLLFLDLHSKHAGHLDSWELATYLYDGTEGAETMPKLIMKHVGEKFPNNKRFRYT